MEDFANFNAVPILARYRDRVCCYNDDIQGTAAVALAGILAALRITGQRLTEQRFLFLGGGSAATGIAELISQAMAMEGLSIEAARARNWLFDVNGLIVELAHRPGRLPEAVFATTTRRSRHFVEAIEAIRPDRHHRREHRAQAVQPGGDRGDGADQRAADHLPLLQPDLAFGMHGRGGLQVVGGPGDLRQRQPVPAGRASTARRSSPARATTSTSSPPWAWPCYATEAKRVTDEMFIVAARAVAEQVTEANLALGLIYPPTSNMLDASLHTAARIADYIFEHDLAGIPRPDDVAAHIRAMAYKPVYPA